MCDPYQGRGGTSDEVEGRGGTSDPMEGRGGTSDAVEGRGGTSDAVEGRGGTSDEVEAGVHQLEGRGLLLANLRHVAKRISNAERGNSGIHMGHLTQNP